MRFVTFARSALTVALLTGTIPASSQDLPAGPVRAFSDTLTVGGEVVATAGSADTTAFFNYTDYEHNALRMVRLALSGEWRPLQRLAMVAELRSEDFNHVTAHAAYVRVRPWLGQRFDIQAGRIPPTFGAFGRRAYSTSDGLIGYPLAYQYLTSLRADAVPARADDLLVMRGRGWRANYPIGNPEPAPGVPLASAFRWDTGVQAHWASDRMTMTTAVTNGPLSSPRTGSRGDPQLSGRVTVRPSFGLVIGTSASRGAWLSSNVDSLLPDPSQSYVQTAAGADVEYSHDHWIVRAEAVWSRWRVPTPLSPEGASVDVSALGAFVEARYRFTPRAFVAARLDNLSFSSLTTASATSPVSWDAPVRRVEVGAGYMLQRNLTARVSLQHNARDGGRVRQRTFVSGQLAFWF